MTEKKEFHGASVEEAAQKAASFLGISEDALEYDVIDEGSVGFLGIGTRDARISVRNAAASRNWVNSEDVVRETFDGPTDETPVDEAPAEEKPLPAHETSSLNVDATTEEAESTGSGVDSTEPESEEDTPEEVLQDIRSYVDNLLNAMEFDSRVDVYDAADYVAVDVATPETGLFIGQKGETIDAVQHLLNAAVYKGRPYGKRVVVDTEGYRQRRIEALQGMAHRSARRAIRESRVVELPPMNSSERRIVHVYLKDNAQVTTLSEGTGSNRRVTISPEE